MNVRLVFETDNSVKVCAVSNSICLHVFPSPVGEASLYDISCSQIQISIFKNDASIFSTQFHLQRNHASFL